MELDCRLRPAVDDDRGVDAALIDLSSRDREPGEETVGHERLQGRLDILLNTNDGRPLARAGPEDLRPSEEPELRSDGPAAPDGLGIEVAPPATSIA